MPKICVEIELDTDTGAVMVGVEPPDDAGYQGQQAGQGDQPEAGDQADKQYLQPAQSVEDALSTAKDLLTNPQAQAAQGEQQGGQSQNDMWNKVQRDRAMQTQPGGPLMGQQ